MTFSQNIKRLRKIRNLTQDALSRELGVSYQTISKWECGDSFPDLGMVMNIAYYFEVSLDELCGMDEVRNQRKYDEIKTVLLKNYRENRAEDNIVFLKEQLKSFPDNIDLWFELGRSQFLTNVNGDESNKDILYDAIDTFKYILSISDNNKIRSQASYFISLSYYYGGNADEALNAAKEVQYGLDRNIVLSTALSGNDRDECLRNNITALCAQLCNQLREYSDPDVIYNYMRVDYERRMILEKAVSLLEWLYEDGDFLSVHKDMSDLYRVIGAIYMHENNHDQALKALDKAADHAIAFDNLPKDKLSHTSLLVRGMVDDLSGFIDDSSNNMSFPLLNGYLTQERYDPIRRRKEFNDIRQKLKTQTDGKEFGF